MKTAIELIAEERQRQIAEEGWTIERDQMYSADDLVLAAATYALPERIRLWLGRKDIDIWPWSSSWWKPSPDNRIKELTKAGALIAAEIERLQHLAQIKEAQKVFKDVLAADDIYDGYSHQ